MESSTIVVLGGPAAGKTVFLSALYHHLWSGTDDITMRAVSGTMHSELKVAAEQIQSGNLPPATQALRHYEFELDYGKRHYYLRFLDYPGELFRKVFYEGTVESDEARELYEISTSANGVIALADPQSILDGTWNLDYALTNLLRFYRSRNREQPKFVLAFTKRDVTELLVGNRVATFVRQHLPHLAAELGEGMHLQHFCSILRNDGRVHYAQAATVTAPLRCVVQAIENERYDRDRRAYLRRLAWKRTVIWCLIALIVAGGVLAAFFLGVIARDYL